MVKTLALFMSVILGLSALKPSLNNPPQKQKDEEDHVLVSRWKAFYDARNADKPKDALKILSDIRQVALSDRLAWDFYDACSKEADLRTAVNWKERNAARKEKQEAVRAYGEPVAVFHMGFDGALQEASAFVDAHSEALKKSCNPEFWSRDWRMTSHPFSDALVTLMHDDYEYASWCLWIDSGKPEEVPEVFRGRYPFDAFAEYLLVCSREKGVEDALKAFGEKYSGRAVSLLSGQSLLQREFQSLNEKGGSSGDYSALRKKCADFISSRSSFKGNEQVIASCCTLPAGIISELDSENVDFGVEDEMLKIRLRNLKSVDVALFQDSRKIWSAQAKNAAGSYYRMDTLSLSLPECGDGDYRIRCSHGEIVQERDLHKHTLSLSCREDRDGYAVFVADYRTGEPVSKCSVVLLDNSGKPLPGKEWELEIDGFTRLPEDMGSAVRNRKGKCLLKAQTKEGRFRDSESLRPGPFRAGTEESTIRSCSVITDRSAYLPGETVSFKAVLYESARCRVLPGVECKAALVDMRDGSTVSQTTLTTNEFGSVAGSFGLKDCKNRGRFSIEIRDGESVFNSNSFQVDDFTPPSFEIIWDNDGFRYLSGCDVHVSGTLSSYSGHGPGAASVSYSLSKYGVQLDGGKVSPGSDGHFSIDFSPEEEGFYVVKVKCISLTGETLEFSSSFYVTEVLALSVVVENTCRGAVGTNNPQRRLFLVKGDARLGISCNVFSGQDVPVTFRLLSEDGREVLNGKTTAGQNYGKQVTLLPTASLPSGMYTLVSEASVADGSGKVRRTEYSLDILKVGASDQVLDAPADYLFMPCSSRAAAVKVGVTGGPAWVVAEAFGPSRELLGKKIVKLEGVRGMPGSLETVSFSGEQEWSGCFEIKLMFFRNGKCRSYTHTVPAKHPRETFPLSFSRFVDSAAPSSKFEMTLHSLPGVECAVSVFDAGTDAMLPLVWDELYLRQTDMQHVQYGNVTGHVDCGYGPLLTKSAARYLAAGAAVSNEEGSDALPYLVPESASADAVYGQNSGVVVRKDFLNALAWYPCLHTDAAGDVSFEVRSSDKLSRYIVQVFAHGKDGRSAVMRSEMSVTIPVKVSIVQPRFLYEGDSYVASIALSNNTSTPVGGTLSVCFLDGGDPKNSPVVQRYDFKVNIPAADEISVSCPVELPSLGGTLGVLAKFTADTDGGCSDAMLVDIPVYSPVQDLTEAHSCLLRPGYDRIALVDSLRRSFVNLDASGLDVREISISAMLGEALSEVTEPESDNVVDCTETLWSRFLMGSLGMKVPDSSVIVGKIKSCQNPDGGFGWFPGMNSSPAITSLVLESFAHMGKDGVDVRHAVEYLDSCRFRKGFPEWCGWLPLDRYLHVRSMYPEVPLGTEGVGSKALKAFRKDVRDYLSPGKERGLQGRILAKARRVSTLRSLLSSDAGMRLAGELGLRGNVCRSLSRSASADVASLLQYAVEHDSGGCYFPNAVMPWRGLQDGELYAHSLLCDLFSEVGTQECLRVADGLRLWIMVQKETQQWGSDPAYIRALSSVFHGSESLLSTKVLSISGSYCKRFSEVKPSGNGFTIERRWYLCGGSSQEQSEILPGTELHVGDKVRAEYRIHSDENRSFVRILSPRPACLSPVERFSGPYGWWGRIVGAADGSFSIMPQSYRSVLPECSEYWVDAYPEEDSTIVEDFFVTQEGVFDYPSVSIESMYAPHYRANGGAQGPMKI